MVAPAPRTLLETFSVIIISFVDSVLGGVLREVDLQFSVAWQALFLIFCESEKHLL